MTMIDVDRVISDVQFASLLKVLLVFFKVPILQRPHLFNNQPPNCQAALWQSRFPNLGAICQQAALGSLCLAAITVCFEMGKEKEEPLLDYHKESEKNNKKNISFFCSENQKKSSKTAKDVCKN